MLSDGRVRGDNTDGIGLVNDILRQGAAIKAKKVLLLGAGGAVRGVLQPLLAQMPAELVVANRTLSKAAALADAFGVQACALADLPHAHFDIVINGTSGGLGGEVPAINAAVFGVCELAYDMVYGEAAAAFAAFARAGGARTVSDGLGMLVGQAAASYQLWRGFAPDIAAVIHDMREVHYA